MRFNKKTAAVDGRSQAQTLDGWPNPGAEHITRPINLQIVNLLRQQIINQ